MHDDRLKHTTKIWGQVLRPSSVWCKRDIQRQTTKMRMIAISMCFSGRRREGVVIWGTGHQSGLDFSRAFDLQWLSCDPENSSFCSSLSQFLLSMVTQKMVLWLLWLLDYGYQTYHAGTRCYKKVSAVISKGWWCKFSCLCITVGTGPSRSKCILGNSPSWDLWWSTSKSEDYP